MLKRIIPAVLIAVALPVFQASAQTIPNPSFEANSFTVNPGYVSDNIAITGWTVSSTTNIGLNPASGSPFANNGATPNGANVAFIQSNGNVLNTLSNNMTGLIVGNRYRVTFRANSRDGFGLTTNSTWSVNGGAFVRYTSSPPVQAAGNFTSPYRTNSALFTATATTAPLVLANRSTNDSTVLLDDFTIVDLLVVTNTASGGPGSLVDTIAIAASLAPTRTVTFAANLSGATITLTNEIVLTNSLIITATNLPAGITINGGAGANRIFSLDESANVQMIGLTLTGGDGGGAAQPNYGGAIYNAGTLVLSGCTLYSNRAEYGGAIMHFGTMLAMTNCTLSGNTATGGVASAVLFQLGDGFMTHCTVTANSAENQGFAVANNSVLTLANSIIADNAGGDVSNQGMLTRVGANIVPSFGNIGSVSGPAFLTDGPHLAPLGNYGGPTRTAPPLAGSPATDAAVGSTTTSDQRGRTRPLDGNTDGLAVADLGAVEQQVAAIVVTNGTDTGNGTLRAAFAVAATNGPTIDVTYIRFTNTLSGATIVLTNEIAVTASGVVVDASDLSQQLTLDGGPGSNRIFFVDSARSLSLLDLTLTGGGGAGAIYGGYGGAICVVGFLHLADCTLSGNASPLFGGAIQVFGRLNMTRCTISGNNAGQSGGAIHASFASAAMTLSNCTISENNAGLAGGGGLWLQDAAQMTLTHCTVSSNVAPVAGGIAVLTAAGTAVLANSIVAGNTAGFGPDIYNDSILTRAGTSIVRTAIVSTGTVTGSGTILAVNPLLGPLTNNGGRTKTMALLPGSPALDRAGGSTLTVDQRGLLRTRDGDGNGSKISDIGAFEAQTPPANGPEGHMVDTVADELDPEGVLGTGMSLREAVRDALPSGNIFFDTTLFNGQVADRIVLSNALGQIVLSSNVRIVASNNVGGVTVDGGPGSNRVFHVPSGITATVQRLTVSGGVGTDDFGRRGGGIYNEGHLSVVDCLIVSNVAPASVGGGILNVGTLFLERSTIAFNSADLRGGGVNNFNSAARLFATNCTFYGNTSLSDGGGLMNVNNATSTLVHCTFTANTATNAGGIYRISGTVNLNNSIVAGNVQPSGRDMDGAIVVTGANITNGTALLGSLGNYGGPTPTVPLLAGSPAIDAAVGSSATIDQRGRARPVDGNVNGSSVADLGAVERQITTIVVTNGTDAGNGTLRAALATVATNTADITLITFTNTLSGSTIVLTNEISMNANEAVVDASDLPQQLTLDGGSGSNRIFFVGSGTSLSLLDLTLTGGGGAGAVLSGVGGAICLEEGFLHLANCTLSGNASADLGGAIAAYGRLNMAHCTISSNQSQNIGAIFAGSATAALTLSNCTIFGNNSSAICGGLLIQSSAQATLTHCTVSGNAAAIAAGGIAVLSDAGTVVLANSIVAGNTAGFGPDFYNDAILTRVGANIVQTTIVATGTVSGSGTILAVDPLLAPLGNYGGPTPTVPLLAGSPAIDAAVGSASTNDQRGFPIIGIPDIGAFEYDQITANYDSDADGFTDAEEYISDTQPANAASFFPEVLLTNAPAGQMSLLIDQASTGRVYGVYANTNLLQTPQAWTLVPPEQTGTAAALTLTITNSLPGANYRTGVRLP